MRVAIMRTHGIGNQDITAGDVFDIDLMQAPLWPERSADGVQ